MWYLYAFPSEQVSQSRCLFILLQKACCALDAQASIAEQANRLERRLTDQTKLV